MKIKIHPLFFAVIIICALFGGLPATLICLLTALMHECGHIFCARSMGFSCTQIRLMPYGAAAVCDIGGISPKDEIKLALAGPSVNAALCITCAALWWFFPVTYAYTDTIMYANLGMLIFNLLPAYPLDGGRVAAIALAHLTSKRTAHIILKVVAGVCAAALFALFFVFKYNVLLLALSIFLAASTIEKSPRASLVNYSLKCKLKRGMEVKYVLCDSSLTFAAAFKLLEENRYLVLQLYDDGVADEISEDELYALASTQSFSDSVFKSYFSRNERQNFSCDMLPATTQDTHSAPKSTASSTAPESEAKS